MIFITGANGLIGSFIVRELLKKKIRPRCLKRSTSDLFLLEDVSNQVDWVEGNLLDIPGLDLLFQGVDTVIHAAAVVSFNPENYDIMYKTNVEGTANLVNIALNKNIKKFLFVSSIASLGKSKKYNIIDETAQWEEGEGMSFYAKTKYLSELEVWRGTEEGLNAVVINPTIVLGPGDWRKGSTRLFKYAFEEHTFFPRGNINFVDVRDVAQIAIKLIDRDIKNERFILNAGNVSYKEFFEKAAREFSKKPPFLSANGFITAIGWRMATLVAFIKRTQALLTKETAQASKNNYRYENEKVKKLLQYEFRELNSTISWAISEIQKREFDMKNYIKK
jgi:dihydroflavonol-4-reductase